jgi:hypothetical protein
LRTKLNCEGGIVGKKFEDNVKPSLRFTVSKNTGRLTVVWDSNFTSFEVEEIVSVETSDRMMDAKLSRKHVPNRPVSLFYEESALQRGMYHLTKRFFVDHYIFSNPFLICFNHAVVEDLRQGKELTPTQNQGFIQEIKSFVDQYCALREVEKKMLKESGQPYSSENLRQKVLQDGTQSVSNSTVRYTGGAKERARERMDNGTADENDKAILEGHLCAFCGGNLSAASKVRGVESTYCSRECAEEGRLKRGGMYSSTRVRDQLFALEFGVCCLCGINAHALYTRIAALEPAERLNALCNANWKLPVTAKALERLLQNPKEAHFWNADHITAVAEGGGGCGLDNLRTLCVPCHAAETEKLQRRLKLSGGKDNKDDSSSSKRQTDIRSMFGRIEPK